MLICLAQVNSFSLKKFIFAESAGEKDWILISDGVAIWLKIYEVRQFKETIRITSYVRTAWYPYRKKMTSTGAIPESSP